MAYKRNITLFYLLLICFLTNCNRQEPSYFSEGEKMRGEIEFQYSESSKSLKGEAQFFIQGKEGIRPYFLLENAQMNGIEMKKKHTLQKGVYYIAELTDFEQQEILFSFANNPEKKEKLSFEIEKAQWKEKIPKTLSRSQLPSEDYNSWILLDAASKLHQIDSETKPGEIATGLAQIVKVLEKDTTIQLSNLFELHCKIRTLSSSRIIKIE